MKQIVFKYCVIKIGMMYWSAFRWSRLSVPSPASEVKVLFQVVLDASEF